MIHPDIRRELGRDRVAELARARATASRDERNPRGLRRLLRLWAGRLWPPNHQTNSACAAVTVTRTRIPKAESIRPTEKTPPWCARR